MSQDIYAGYVLTARLPAASTTVEHWREKDRMATQMCIWVMPTWLHRPKDCQSRGLFLGLTGMEVDGTLSWSPGRSVRDLASLGQLVPNALLAFAWHLAAAIAKRSTNMAAPTGCLHPSYVGINHRGSLSIRPTGRCGGWRSRSPMQPCRQPTAFKWGNSFNTLS